MKSSQSCHKILKFKMLINFFEWTTLRHAIGYFRQLILEEINYSKNQIKTMMKSGRKLEGRAAGRMW